MDMPIFAALVSIIFWGALGVIFFYGTLFLGPHGSIAIVLVCAYFAAPYYQSIQYWAEPSKAPVSKEIPFCSLASNIDKCYPNFNKNKPLANDFVQEQFMECENYIAPIRNALRVINANGYRVNVITDRRCENYRDMVRNFLAVPIEQTDMPKYLENFRQTTLKKLSYKQPGDEEVLRIRGEIKN